MTQGLALEYVEVDVPYCLLKYGVAPCQAADPDENLLLHFDGADGSTTIVDSAKNYTLTAVGNAQIDTAQSKFGGSSAVFDGTGDRITAPGFHMGTGDFTIDFWMRRNGAQGQTNVFSFSGSAIIYVTGGGNLRFFFNGADRISGGVFSNDVWHHVALTRSGNDHRLFMNGVQQGSTYNSNNDYVSTDLVLGDNGSGGSGLNGWMEEIRVRKGSAVWTSGFTPPTGPHGTKCFNSKFTCQDPDNFSPARKGGFHARYFNNTTLTAPSVHTMYQIPWFADPFNGPGSPVNTTNFSVVWTGYLRSPVSGPLTFYIRHDDGGRLYLNEVLVINDFNTGAARTNSFTIGAGKNELIHVRFDFFQGTGGSEAKLEWSYEGFSQAAVPADFFSGATLRFAKQTEYLPKDIPCLPYVKSTEFTPSIVSLGENLGQRATLRATFTDHPHSDAGVGYDKYYSERAYVPYAQGTHWGKFRARHPFLRGVEVRWIMGFVGEELSVMETRHFFVDSFDGLKPEGEYSLFSKDVLKYLDGDRAQAPALSTGFLNADVSDAETVMTLAPAGVLDSFYEDAGYLNIGGNEIVEYVDDQAAMVTSDTKLLLHCDGADASTTFTDSSPSARGNASVVGNAQVDTEHSRFGGASVMMDGAGDSLTYADSNDWTFAGDFTVDMWIRLRATTATTLMIHATDANNAWHFRVDGTNALNFIITSGGSDVLNFISSTGQFLINTWYHVALTRSGNVWRLWKNGVIIASLTQAQAVPNFAGQLRIGNNVSGTASLNGWFDEISVHHAARWTATFIPPGAAYSSSTAPNRIRVRRAQLGTQASSHSAQDRVQKVLIFSAQDPADIIADLLEDFTDTPAGYVQRSTWLTETSNNLGTNYSAVIAEPTSVSKLISELVEQCALAIWDDDINQVIKLQVLRGIPTDADTFDAENILLPPGMAVADQPDKRVSQVWVYYGQIDPTKRVDDSDNYRSTSQTIDADAEVNYGSPAIRKIFARWIPALGSVVADRLGDVVLSRYTDAPRKLNFEVMRRSVLAPILGQGYRVGWWSLQDEFGAEESVPVQVIRLKPSMGKLEVEAEELRFKAIAADLGNRQIFIDTNINNVNLRTIHDSIYPDPIGGMSPPLMVTCTVAAGVIVGSTSVGFPAFDVGSWPAGIDILLVVEGRIQGKGGDGGDGTFVGENGGVGGVALFTRYAIDLTYTDGEIWGGGGGGGGNLGASGDGGGGGAGQLPGAPGTGAVEPSPATTEVGGNSRNAGDGGGPGLAGGNSDGTGGAAGKGIDGNSFVTVVGGAGDLRGGTIN